MPSSCFLPFLTKLPGNLAWPLPSSSVWDPVNATTADLATTVREICSRKGSILLFRAASCQESSSKCCSLPPPVLVHRAHSTSAVLVTRQSLIRPFSWMVLIWFRSKRKGTWKNSYGVLFSLSQSQLGLFFPSIFLCPYLIGKPRLLSPGFCLTPSLFSQKFLIPQLHTSLHFNLLSYKSSF